MHLAGLAGFALGEGQIFVDHMLHLVQVALHGRGSLEGRCEGQLQTQSGQGRAEIMADRGEQGGALVDVALDAVAHVHEGPRGGPDLARAVRLEPLTGLAPPEGFGGGGKTFNGPHLIADEQNGDRHQQHGGGQQPDDEDVRLGRHGPLARGDNAHDAVTDLDPDVDVVGVTGRIEPERAIKAGRKRGLKRPVDNAYGAAADVLGQGRGLLPGDGQGQGAFGPSGQGIKSLRRRVLRIGLDRPGDVSRQTFGQAGIHRLPVGVEEGPGDEYLHDQDRQDDDQQGPPPQGGRQPSLEEACPDRGREEFHGTGPSRRASVRCQHIADAAHGLQITGVLGVDLELAAQAGDLNVHGATGDVGRVGRQGHALDRGMGMDR